MTDQPVQQGEQRPLGVLVVAAVQFLRGILLVAQLTGLTIGIDWLRIAAQVPDPPTGTLEFALSRGFAIALVVATLVVGYGLLAGRRWGWVGAIILSGLSLAFSIAGWWDGHPTYVSMLINVVAVFYLNQRDVRVVYEDADIAAGQTPS
jgi:hypothetical protein